MPLTCGRSAKSRRPPPRRVSLGDGAARDTNGLPLGLGSGQASGLFYKYVVDLDVRSSHAECPPRIDTPIYATLVYTARLQYVHSKGRWARAGARVGVEPTMAGGPRVGHNCRRSGKRPGVVTITLTLWR